MIVTGICPASKGKNRIYIDEEYVFFLYTRELRQFELKEGQPVSQELVDHILSEYVLKRAKRKAMDLLQRQDYSVADLRLRLKRAEYTEEVILQVIEYLEGFHYLDDVRYARQFISGRLEIMGRRQMTSRLLAKGIAREDIEQAFNQLSQEEVDLEQREQEALQRLLLKKLNGREPEQVEDREWNRIFQFLARRGFSQSIIYSAIHDYKRN
ncbi:MAG: regulatory protein RecX [Lachnospiraceae bacterium]|nr:regulatory protein RecX [Lachnospiraceae bacterium]